MFAIKCKKFQNDYIRTPNWGRFSLEKKSKKVTDTWKRCLKLKLISFFFLFAAMLSKRQVVMSISPLYSLRRVQRVAHVNSFTVDVDFATDVNPKFEYCERSPIWTHGPPSFRLQWSPLPRIRRILVGNESWRSTQAPRSSNTYGTYNWRCQLKSMEVRDIPGHSGNPGYSGWH